MWINNQTTLMSTVVWGALFSILCVKSLTISTTSSNNKKNVLLSLEQSKDFDIEHESRLSNSSVDTRREMITKATGLTAASFFPAYSVSPKVSTAAVGTLPELIDTNAIVQGLTINVADASQQKSMIEFLVNGFSFEILRQRIQNSVEETWLGFGPEQLSVPKDFVIPVSSFSKYGGHASINVRYDSQSTAPLYREGDEAPGDNIAYLQLGVPGYRISQMVANGGKILDAYGLVNVVSPSGLPFRGIVGIWPDPIMFVAINCKDVNESKEFYEKLGFVEQEVPYSRPSKGATLFEPKPPKGSYYMSPSPTSMGVLLLQGKKRKTVTPNPVVESLNIVCNPSSSSNLEEEELILKDPSGVPVKFMSETVFSATERTTR